ncbi:vacuolar (H+)-ATPase G subunit [Dictyocaulus viviparus]|uniref:Vacuolar (H+)-ATPase G subunit n=1 Tax=Dictyocaulus viviparus TaxID=29172 RepID=A0A0D8Y2N9_DICVI|nr:vacuolar (H+)-ATPase G subunit [Dictyocaulus viviparus]
MSCSSLRGQAAYFNPIWEAEANGESKIIEATKRRIRRKREARYLAYAEIEQFREEKEEQFRKKCALLKEEEERQKERIRNNVDEEVAWMKARVKLCKPIVIIFYYLLLYFCTI